MDPMLNKAIKLVLKLVNVAYAAPNSSEGPFKKFTPRPAHMAVNIVNSSQTKAACNATNVGG